VFVVNREQVLILLPLSVKDKTKLKPSMAALSHPRINEDPYIFSSDSKDGFCKSSGRYQHSTPLVGLALLLGRLNS
jgi:hypothetical protein